MTLSPSASSSPADLPSAGEPQEIKNHTLLLSQPLIWLFAIVGLTFPFLPIYFAGIGLSDSKIALLLAVPSLVMLVGGQVFGYITDIHLNQKSAIFLLSLLGIIVYAAFPHVRGFSILMVLMAFQAISVRPRIAIVTALVLSNSGGERRFGFLRSIGSVAFIAAAGGAGWLADRYPGQGVAIVFPIAVLVNILCAVSILPLRDHPIGHGRRIMGENRTSFWQVQRQLVAQPLVRVFLAFVLISQLVHGTSVIFQTRLITDPAFIGASNFQATLALNIGAFAEIAVFLFFNRLVAKIRLMPLFFIAVATQSLRWGMIFLFPVLPVIHASNILNMFTFGLMHIGTIVFINREVAPHLRASGQTILGIVYMTLSSTLGQMLASVFFHYGTVLQWYGLASVLTLFSLPFWLRMKRLYEAKHNVSGFWVR